MQLLIKDFKMQLLMISVFILFLLCCINSSTAFKEDQNNYKSSLSMLQSQISSSASSMLSMIGNGEIYMFEKPNITYHISNEAGYPNSFHSLITCFSTFEWGNNSDRSGRTFTLNWLFIVGILGSLIALLFSYDLISKEKQSGTFRLTVVEGVSRIQVLLSKYISTLVLLVIAILPGLVFSMTVYMLMIHTFSLELIGKSFVFLLVSIPYLSFFVLCGLWISTSKNYRNTIIKTMVLWLMFTVIVPQAATILSKRMMPVKSETEYNKEMGTARQKEYDKWYEIAGGDKVEFNSFSGNGHMEDGIRYKGFSSMRKASAAVYEKQNIDFYKQKELEIYISMLSPYSLLSQITDVVLNIGYYRYQRAAKQFKEFYNVAQHNVVQEDAKDTNSAHYFYSDAAGDDNLHDGRHVFSIKPFPHPEQLLLDNDQEDNIGGKLLSLSFPLLILLLLNLIVWVFIYYKIIRFDVR